MNVKSISTVPKTSTRFRAPLLLGLLAFAGFAGNPALAQVARPPSELEEVCNDGIDNDHDGVTDQESPVFDGYERYEFRMRVKTNCEEYEMGSGGVEDAFYSCLLTDTIQLKPGQDPSFTAEHPHCDGVGPLIVDGNVNKKGKLTFDISTYYFDAFHGNGSLCDGELWNLTKPDQDWLKGYSGEYEKGDCDAFGWCADCKTHWTIDIVPVG